VRYNATDFLNSLFMEPAVSLTPGPGITLADLPADWHELWDERAAIMEYDGGLPREHAEAAALSEILKLMRAAGLAVVAPMKYTQHS
jgi:hypothetical protein